MCNQDKVPESGYKFPKWDGCGFYRSTALAYMKRENEPDIQHDNGRWYTLEEIENAIIKG